MREWCKFRYGIFPENGLIGDRIYPETYMEGNKTVRTLGCVQRDPVCPLGKRYNREAPTKQNLLCNGESAMETILNHSDFRVEWSPVVEDVKTNDTGPVFAKIATYPTFDYIVPKSNRYVLLLDRTSMMGIKDRWTNIKRSFFRFISHLPVGSELSIISFDNEEAVVNLPPTVVTDDNREGLHGRIPRKVDPPKPMLEPLDFAQPQISFKAMGCTFCALNMSLNQALTNYVGKTDVGTIIMVTGAPQDPQQLPKVLDLIQSTPIQVYPILYPSTANRKLMKLGSTYVVPELGTDDGVQPLTYLTEVLLSILKQTEVHTGIQKVHEAVHGTEEFSGTFTMEGDILHKMSVTLSLDDEDRVEFFEITNPSGRKHLLSQFEEGMVVFNHPGLAEPGIWSYHAKLYPDHQQSRINRMTVDVISQSNNAEAEPIILDAFTSVSTSLEVIPHSNPIVIYARVTRGGHTPVIDAHVTAIVYRPVGPPVTLILRDNGLGFPDVTGEDGIYSAYFTSFDQYPGFYSIRVLADNNDGLARTPKASLSAPNFTTALNLEMSEDEGLLSHGAFGNKNKTKVYQVQPIFREMDWMAKALKKSLAIIKGGRCHKCPYKVIK